MHGVSSLDDSKVNEIVEKIRLLLPSEEEATLRYVHNYRT